MKYFIGNNFLEYENYQNSTIEDCLTYCSTQTILGLDIETSRRFKKGMFPETHYKPGLDPYLSRICMLQIGDLENQFVIDARVVPLDFLKPILESKTILKVGHNLKFEGLHIYKNYQISLVNVWDTMICERVLYNGLNLSYSLEALSYRYLDSTKKVQQVEMFAPVDSFEELEDLDELSLLDADFSFVIDKSIRLDFVEIGDKPFTQRQLDYACDDILMPLLIQREQVKGREITGEHYLPTKGFLVENAFTQTLAKIELKGLTVNTQGWQELYKVNMKRRLEIKEFLNQFIIKHYPKFANQMNLFSPEPTCSIEWESSKQVIELFKHLKICPKEFSKQTKQVEYTVGAKSLFRLLKNENKDFFYKAEVQEFQNKEDYQALIINYLIYKKYQLLTTTFGLEWLNWIHPITHKVHTSFRQLMNTGRMASSNPNCQQIPSGKVWRELFIADKGYKLGAVDYSAQEARIASEVHNEEKMQDFFIHGHPIHKDDIHCFVASAMFAILRNDPNLIITKEQKKERNIAKSLGFKILYGGGAFTIAQDLGIELQEGEEFVEAYLAAFPGLAKSFDQAKKLAVERGWVEVCGYTKKKYFFPDFQEMKELYDKAWSFFPKNYKDLNPQKKKEFRTELYAKKPEVKTLFILAGKLKGKLERAALNFPIQGAASSMVKLATILIEKSSTSLKEGVILLVHDELLTQYPEELAEAITLENENLMRKAGLFLCAHVPMNAVGEVGDHWIH